MIDIFNHSFLKYLLFGSLYFSEGLNKIIAVIILPIYFLEKGVSPEIITLVIGLSAMPMVIKFVWGGIVDFFNKFGRKKFIFFGGIMSVVSLLTLAFIDPGIALIPFAIFETVCWIGVGFLDVSTDAWAIEISKEVERGKINGFMYGGLNAGMAIGAVTFPLLAKNYSYSAVFIGSAFLIFLIIIFPIFIKERVVIEKSKKIGKLILGEFKKKTTIVVTFFAITFALSSGMLLFIAPLYMDINLKLDLTQIGFITLVFTITTAIGSMVGGMIADKWGRKKTLTTIIILSTTFCILLIFSNDWQKFLIMYGIIGFLQGGYYTTALALFMDTTNPKIAATEFSIFTSLGNFGNIGIASISGALFAMFSFNHIFLYSAWLFGPVLLIIYFIK